MNDPALLGLIYSGDNNMSLPHGGIEVLGQPNELCK